MIKTCDSCGSECLDIHNFCGNCGEKLAPICPRCWRKDGQPFQCDGNSCPGDEEWLTKYGEVVLVNRDGRTHRHIKLKSKF